MSAIELKVRRSEAGVEVLAPGPGYWRNAPGVGSALTGGETCGELEVLGVVHVLVLPKGAAGVRVPDDRPKLARRAVSYGEVLCVLDPEAVGELGAAEAEAAAAGASGLVFRSPSSGRYYGRPAPDRDAFVNVGDTIEEGHTIGLLEVMKTFTRLTYGGSGLPSPAKVVRIVPTDEDDLSANDPILEVEPG